MLHKRSNLEIFRDEVAAHIGIITKLYFCFSGTIVQVMAFTTRSTPTSSIFVRQGTVFKDDEVRTLCLSYANWTARHLGNQKGYLRDCLMNRGEHYVFRLELLSFAI